MPSAHTAENGTQYEYVALKVQKSEKAEIKALLDEYGLTIQALLRHGWDTATDELRAGSFSIRPRPRKKSRRK